MVNRHEVQRQHKRGFSKSKGKSSKLSAYWTKVEEQEEEETELVRILKEDIVPNLEETANARRRQEEKGGGRRKEKEACTLGRLYRFR